MLDHSAQLIVTDFEHLTDGATNIEASMEQPTGYFTPDYNTNCEIDTDWNKFGAASMLTLPNGLFVYKCKHIDPITSNPVDDDIHSEQAYVKHGANSSGGFVDFLSMGMYDTADDYSFAGFRQTGSSLQCRCYDVNGVDHSTVTSGLSEGSEHHLEIDDTGSTVYFFIDGVQVAAISAVLRDPLTEGFEKIPYFRVQSTDSSGTYWMDGLEVGNVTMHTSGFTPPTTAPSGYDTAGIATLKNPVGGIIIFDGLISEIEGLGRTGLKVTVKSAMELFNVKFPHNVYTPGCGWVLYSPGCGQAKDDYISEGVVVGSEGTIFSFGTDRTDKDDEYYDMGVIWFTSGDNEGAIRTVKSYLATGAITLSRPLFHAPAAADTFKIYPGCDHTMEMCDAKFDNLAHYRGFPYIPSPETAK